MNRFAIMQKEKKKKNLYLNKKNCTFQFKYIFMEFYYVKRTLFFRSRKHRTGGGYNRQVSPKVTLTDNKTQINL